MDEEFIKRVAKGVTDIIFRITRNNSDIRMFCVSLINILRKVCKLDGYNIFRYESILTFLLKNGLKIPKSMKNDIDENFMRDLMCYLDNVRQDEEFNEVINEIELILKEFDPGLNLGLREDISSLKAGLIGNMNDSTVFYGCTEVGKTLDNLAKNNNNISIICQTNDSEKFNELKLKAELLNLQDFVINQGSTILNTKFVGKNKFDYAIVELLGDFIPSKEEYEEIKQMMNSQKDVFILGKATQTSHAFITIQQVIYSLSDKGKAFFIVPSGIFYKNGKDKDIREQLIRRDIIETVITLPTRLATKTPVSFSIIIFNKAKKNLNQIQLINAQNMGEVTLKNKMEFTENEIESIINVYCSKEEKYFSKNISIKQIEEKDFSLFVDDYVPLEEKILKTNYFSHIEVNTTEIDKIFKQKKWYYLDSIAEILKGVNVLKSKDNPNGEFKVLNMSGLKDGEIDYSDIIRSNINNFNSHLLLDKNDILISCKGEAIKIAIVDKETDRFTVTQSTMIIRAKGDIEAKYLELYLSSPLGRYLISKIQKGTYIPMISLKDLEKLPVVIPPLEEQKKIIEEFEEQENILKNKMDKILNEIKNNRKKLYENMGIENTYSICKEKND